MSSPRPKKPNLNTTPKRLVYIRVRLKASHFRFLSYLIAGDAQLASSCSGYSGNDNIPYYECVGE